MAVTLTGQPRSLFENQTVAVGPRVWDGVLKQERRDQMQKDEMLAKGTVERELKIVIKQRRSGG
jgi:hypothetical protein